MATEAGGTHPTGMLSCFTFVIDAITKIIIPVPNYGNIIISGTSLDESPSIPKG